MKQPDGYDGYEGGAPYWIGPNDQKYYNYNEWLEEDRKYWRGKDEDKHR